MSTPEILKAEKWLTLWNILIISGAALTAIATFFAIRYGDKVSFLKDHELTRFQADAQRDIAQANEKAQAAILGQKALEEKTERLKHDNLELEMKLEKERAGRLNLQTSLSARRITDEQEKILIRALSKSSFSGLRITSMSDSEAEPLADQLIAIFKTAGWQVQRWPVGHQVPTPYGFIFAIRDNIKEHPATREVISAFHDAKIPLALQNTLGPSEPPTIIVGLKPFAKIPVEH